MKAAIVRIYSVDIDCKLVDYKPLNSDDFGFNITMIIGIKDDKGEESFDMIVCTPKWLLNNFNKEEIIFGRHYLIVFEYNYERILSKLTEYVESIESDSWDDIGERIGRIGHWEFEDYQK